MNFPLNSTNFIRNKTLWPKQCAVQYGLHTWTCCFKVIYNMFLSRSQWQRGLRPLVCWWPVRIPRGGGHGCLSVVIVACCQVEVSATGWSLVRRRLTEYVCVHVCDQAQQKHWHLHSVGIRSQTKECFSRMSSVHAVTCVVYWRNKLHPSALKQQLSVDC